MSLRALLGFPTRRLKYFLENNDSGAWGDEPHGSEGTPVLRSTDQTIDGRWNISDPAYRQLSDTEARSTRLEVGDLVVTKSSGSSRHIGKSTLVDGPIAVLRPSFGNFMQRLRVKSGHDPRYFWYLLNHDIVRSQFDDLSTTSTGLANLNGSVIGQVEFPDAPPDRQHAIADYLDRETARIDTLIDEQQRLIERLRERRSAAIDTAIHPTAEWPEIQLRRLTSAPIDAGVDEQGNPDNPDEWPRFIRTTDIASLTTLDPAKRVTVSPGAAATAALRRNDLVATRAGATIGKTYIHSSDEEACYAGYLVRIRPDVSKVSPMYLAYWSQSTHYLGQVASGAVKSTIENYSAAKYRATTIPVPPLDEQRQIVAYLDEQITKIDTLIAETERFIELSKERRAALITAAVTGQIDVREAA